MRRMAWIAALVVAVMLVAGPAGAETDKLARSRVKKLEAEVETLSTKITALQLQMERLKDANETLQRQADANSVLIRDLVGRIGLEQ